MLFCKLGHPPIESPPVIPRRLRREDPDPNLKLGSKDSAFESLGGVENLGFVASAFALIKFLIVDFGSVLLDQVQARRLRFRCLDQVLVAAFSFDTKAQARFECFGDSELALPMCLQGTLGAA